METHIKKHEISNISYADESIGGEISRFIAGNKEFMIVFAMFLLFYYHTHVPLLFMAGFIPPSFFVVRIAENRIQRHYSGAS